MIVCVIYNIFKFLLYILINKKKSSLFCLTSVTFSAAEIAEVVGGV